MARDDVMGTPSFGAGRAGAQALTVRGEARLRSRPSCSRREHEMVAGRGVGCTTNYRVCTFINIDLYKASLKDSAVEAFDVLGDPVRRRILELLADGERPAGDVAAAVGEEFGVSQPAVSQHLRVLREHGFADVRAVGARRLYAVRPEPLRDVDEWLSAFRRFWT